VGWMVLSAARRPAASRMAAAAATSSTGQLVSMPTAAKSALANSANPIAAFLFNQAPTANPTRTAQSSSGVINGDLNVSDDDSDVITYTVISQPTNGTVALDAAGHYVYTADPTLVASGGADTFQVTVSDAANGFHIHGILGLINLLTFGLIGGDPHSSTATINLSVLAATANTGTPSLSTGVLTGTVTANGDPGDQFTYAGSTTSKGTAVVTTSGDFIYTPTAQARHAAAKLDAPATAKADTFTVTVADDHGGSLAVPITTAIVGANVAPTVTQSAGTPNATSGLVAGAVLGSDADSDPLAYTLTGAAAKGAVVLNADGSFTYTPTALARHNAAFTSDTTDSFTITVADGYGGTVNVPVSVTISPASVTFDWASGAGSQYWTAGDMAALNTAATRLSSYILVAKPVTITTTLIGQNNPGSNFLASSFTNFSSSSPGYYGTVVQTKILTGVDANGGSADSQLTWNFAYPWAIGDTVPGNQYDFQSVAMHEMVHSLGFLSGIGAPGNIDTNWTTFDSFLSTSGGTAVINSDYSWNSAYDANLTGGNGGLYFDGTNAVAVYGGPVPLYTPGTWTSGSSVTHLKATPVKPTGTTGYLMDPSDGYGLGVRVLTPVEIGIMQDLGYTIVSPSSASVFFIVGFGLLRRRRR
ncbi:MAG: Ig-like domain-containing protein, partial [Candidatus Nanopelagicales bacterium]